MRITNKMINNQVFNNLSRSYNRFFQMQNIVTTGKILNKPSDDPLGVTKALSYRGFISELSQYRRNIERAKAMLNQSDYSLGVINDSIIELEDISVQLANGTYDDDARDAAATQVADILNHILEAANGSTENKFIFSGSETMVTPFDYNGNGLVYRGNNSSIYYEIDRAMRLATNIPGGEFLIKPVMTLGEGHDLNPGVDLKTLLANLNNGEGVDLGDNHFTLRTVNGEADIDLTGVVNIEDVIDAINTQAQAQGLTDLTVSISEIGNTLRFVDTSDPYITMNTPLSMLNKGTGVDLAIPTFEIKDDGGNTFTVDLTGATTMWDAVNAINSASPPIPGLTASLTPDGNSITIDSGPGVKYTISDIPNGTVAGDLGLETTDGFTSHYQGSDLDPMLIQTKESADGQSTAADLGILFSSSFNKYDGDDIDPRLTLNTKLSNLRNGLGLDLSLITIVNGHDSFNIDLTTLDSDPNATIKDLIDKIRGSGAGVKLQINDDMTGITLESTIAGQSLVIYDDVENGAASQLGIQGSPDLIGSMLFLKDGLEKNWRDTSESVIDRLQGSQEQVLILRSQVGSRINRVESAYNRNLNQDVYTNKLLSEVEDADMLWAITELTTRETVYQAALSAASRVIQPSLVNFLR
ncbi:MAG: flagellar hook-associated protein 3 [candidate division Zixibacteria bacterium]|nr:flagellar hook-associated protein 3 [candidate division Zixibacteria bacterium]